jgi:hypothetical protein
VIGEGFRRGRDDGCLALIQQVLEFGTRQIRTRPAQAIDELQAQTHRAPAGVAIAQLDPVIARQFHPTADRQFQVGALLRVPIIVGGRRVSVRPARCGGGVGSGCCQVRWWLVWSGL